MNDWIYYSDDFNDMLVISIGANETAWISKQYIQNELHTNIHYRVGIEDVRELLLLHNYFCVGKL